MRKEHPTKRFCLSNILRLALALSLALSFPGVTRAEGTTGADCNSICDEVVGNPVYKGTQVESHCMTFQQTGDASTMDYVMLALDVAAAAACGVACLSTGDPYYSVELCAGLGLVSSAAEFLSSDNLNTSNTGQTVSTLLAASGLATSAATAYQVIRNGGCSDASSQQCSKTMQRANTESTLSPERNRGGASNVTRETQDPDEADATTSAGSTTKSGKCDKTAACMAAVNFGIMAAMRLAAIDDAEKSADDACSQVKSFQTSFNGVWPKGTTRPDSRVASRLAILQLLRDMEKLQNKNLRIANVLAESKRSKGSGQLVSAIESRGLRQAIAQGSWGRDAAMLTHSDILSGLVSHARGVQFDQLKKARDNNRSPEVMLEGLLNQMGFGGASSGQALKSVMVTAAQEVRRLAPNAGMDSVLTSSRQRAQTVALQLAASGNGLIQHAEDNSLPLSTDRRSIFQIVSERYRQIEPRLR